jgi:hypothetical protein
MTMSGLDECKSELSELVGERLPLEQLKARAGEIAERCWGKLDETERQRLVRWLETQQVGGKIASTDAGYSGRQAVMAEAAHDRIRRIVEGRA